MQSHVAGLLGSTEEIQGLLLESMGMPLPRKMISHCTKSHISSGKELLYSKLQSIVIF